MLRWSNISWSSMSHGAKRLHIFQSSVLLWYAGEHGSYVNRIITKTSKNAHTNSGLKGLENIRWCLSSSRQKTEQTEEKDLDSLYDSRITKLLTWSSYAKDITVPGITKVHLVEMMVSYKIEQEMIWNIFQNSSYLCWRKVKLKRNGTQMFKRTRNLSQEKSNKLQPRKIKSD